MIEIRNLHHFYGPYPALRDVNLSLQPGQIVGLFGENGSGKTTLLKILAGLLSGWHGSVQIAGYAPGPESKARVSFLPDRLCLPTNLTGTQCLQTMEQFYPDFDRPKAQAMIDYFQLPAGKLISQYSRGMVEKLQIAMTMSRRAAVYLLDEPLSGVDPAARSAILEGIVAQYDPQACMVISTHLIADVEPLVDRAVFMRAGQIWADSPADDLRIAQQGSIDQFFRREYR